MNLLEEYIDDPRLKKIAAKITSGGRISIDDGLTLYTVADLSLLAMLSGIVRRRQEPELCLF